MSRPGPSRNSCTPGALHRRPGRGVGHRMTAGQQMPAQPASTAPRSPARRGTQASFAPVVSASSATADSRPGISAARSPTRTTAPGRDRSSVAGGGLRTRRRSSTERQHAPRHRARRASRVPDSLLKPRDRSGATDEHRHARAGCLAQPQEQDRRLLLRLQRHQQHGRRLLQIGVGDPARFRRHAGHPGSQELRLLGRMHAGPEVDVVGAQRQSGELGVGVGVGQR